MITNFKIFENKYIEKPEIGDDIVCIDNETGFRLKLTYGKKYKLLNKSDDFYFIINDSGEKDRFLWRRFVTPIEFDMMKMNL